MDLISKLRKIDGSFPPGEQRVADFVLGNLETVTELNQESIANRTQVSVATVNRFCTTLGCEGFRDFKHQLTKSVAVSLQYLGGPAHKDSPSDQLVVQVFGSLIDSLNLARQQLDPEANERAITLLAAAKRVVFLGVGGGSANVAREGAIRFFRLGIPAEAISDGYLQRMIASTLGENDVVVAISASGQARELLESVNIAREYGAKSLSLTKLGSPLAKLTDITLALDLPEDQDIYKPSASRLVLMAIIDVLAAGVARRHPNDVKEYLRRIRMSLVPLSDDTGPKPIGD